MFEDVKDFLTRFFQNLERRKQHSKVRYVWVDQSDQFADIEARITVEDTIRRIYPRDQLIPEE